MVKIAHIAFFIVLLTGYGRFRDTVETELRQSREMEACGAEGAKILPVIHGARAGKKPEWIIICIREYEAIL
jgi:hypothetical protein